MDILAVGNQKGGVGKTATVHNLGACLAAVGRRVLLVDCDPQSSLTQAAGVQPGDHSLADVLGGAQPGRVALAKIIQNVSTKLDIAPAGIALAGVELALTARLGRESVIRKALATVAGRYDLAILDCPPSLGLLTIAALCAARGVIVPSQPQAQDLRGLKLFLETVSTVRTELNPALALAGVLLTFYDPRLTSHRQALEALTLAKLPVFNTRIGRSVRVAEAAGAGQPVTVYDPSNQQSENYRLLAQEVIEWQRKNQT